MYNRLSIYDMLEIKMPEDESKSLRCPRCKGKELMIYDDSFDCISCHMEFEKEDLLLYDEEDILSVEEKSGIVKALKKK